MTNRRKRCCRIWANHTANLDVGLARFKVKENTSINALCREIFLLVGCTVPTKPGSQNYVRVFPIDPDQVIERRNNALYDEIMISLSSSVLG